jgi:hypothetical protein
MMSAPRAGEMSPRTKARVGGALFLATIIGGIVAQEGLAGGLIVGGDAAATANNIIAHQSLFRAAFAVYMVEMSCQVAMVAVFYDLFMPVDHSIARASAAFGYIGCGIKALSRLFMYAPLFVLDGSSYLSGFDPKQLQAISFVLIRINELGAAIAMVFFAFDTVLKGYLMIRATFLPKVLGVLGMISGAAWLAFIYPPLGYMLNLPITLVALVASVGLIGWLIVRGVDEHKWYETVAASASSVWR